MAIPMVLETSLTVLALFGATLTASTFGFGGALFAMPLLTIILGLETATPLYALVGWTTAILVTGTSWQAAKLSLVWRLMVATLIGIPLGVLLVKQLPQVLLTLGLGLFLMGFGVYRLLNWPLPTLHKPVWAYPFGLLAGILGGAYNTNGPPVVVYATMNHWPPETFRASLQTYFLASGFGILISHGLGGLWSSTVLLLYVLSMPGVILGVWLGGWINHRLPINQFERLLFILLIALGLLLLVEVFR